MLGISQELEVSLILASLIGPPEHCFQNGVHLSAIIRSSFYESLTVCLGKKVSRRYKRLVMSVGESFVGQGAPGPHPNHIG